MPVPHPLQTLPLLLCCALNIGYAQAKSPAAALGECARIDAESQRLECYDRLAASAATSVAMPETSVPPASAPASDATEQAAAATTTADPESAAVAWDDRPASVPYSLSRHWELDQRDKRGTFGFRPHMENYLLATYTHRPNTDPYLPFRRLSGNPASLSHAELSFQLGFKMKLLENPMGMPLDIWAAYTQQSFWQADNHEISSPFRESNYQPELMAVMPVDFKLFGLSARYLNIGLVHQSNGQSSTLSRSWNRVYAQLGAERGNFSLTGRVWKRFKEARADDDNPDITDYMGHGDLSAQYRWNEHMFSALGRYNFHTHRGAAQLNWAFPLAHKLKGYVQVLSGYGQSLIDYNYRHHSIGLGVLVDF